jgi:two-component system, OmpR family, response regulator
MRVLVVEDDPAVARLVGHALVEAGYEVASAANGAQGLADAESGGFDLILLDVLLPGMDGLAVCRALRQRGVRVPILILTARDSVPDRVRGLDAGADDYLVKPFAVEELLARVRALGRRLEDDEGIVRVADLAIDPARHEARRGDRAITLTATATEFRLLRYLMSNAGRVLSREQILEQVWGHDAEVTPNAVETYIHYLREKVDHASPRPLIRTVRGEGVRLRRSRGRMAEQVG